ncbi:acyl-CoA Delta-9 desaturase-like [Oppia nitens]|uniref:acyl-CoA Delta-9 desaturase-like n=1 Tax=Oppia nitens TaxID=1686743 RepID=UPI0023DB5E19|nr:acyl-CoA Delta-9 desaturase-like [Oppia nitens]
MANNCVVSNIGTLTASHRYGTHKSFKAKWPLRVILMLVQTLSGQKTIIEWARDHHTHHKYEGTDADIVNINRGFFYAHMGWLMIKRHPDCSEKRKQIDVSYLWSDPIMRFQYNYYEPLVAIFCILVPTLMPMIMFDETLNNSYHLCFLIRFAYTLQLSFCGNSLAHIDWGTKPYDKSMTSVHNDPLIYATLGGAYHNYHHVYPWDYSESEFGWDVNFNVNTAFIDFFHWIGWAYDLKKAPQEVIDKRKQRTGGQQPRTFIQNNVVYDWIYGFFMSSIAIWILLPIKALIGTL